MPPPCSRPPGQSTSTLIRGGSRSLPAREGIVFVVFPINLRPCSNTLEMAPKVRSDKICKINRPDGARQEFDLPALIGADFGGPHSGSAAFTELLGLSFLLSRWRIFAMGNSTKIYTVYAKS